MTAPEGVHERFLTRRQLMERLGMIGAGAFVSQSALAWITRGAGPPNETATSRGNRLLSI